MIPLQSPRQEVLSPHSAKWIAFLSGGTCIFYHGAAASVKQAAALGIEDCDTEYRRWYNKRKKSGTSSFFENRGHLLRRFGNEHDYGGDEYAVPMPTDGKNQSFAEVVIPRVDVDEDSEEEYCISVEDEDGLSRI